MKNEEDEAFDDLARKQGAWGGGFKAKQAMAADKMQESVQVRHGYDWSRLDAAQKTLCEHMAQIKELEAALAQPAQEPENDFHPDYDTEAVLVEEMQRMAKRIEELEAMLERQTARIVGLQDEIRNLTEEE